MKKNIILTTLICLALLVVPKHVKAEENSGTITSLIATSSSSVITISGVASDDVTAGVVVITDLSGNVLDTETFEVKTDHTFFYVLGNAFSDGEYKVRVADYSGGTFKDTVVSVGPQKEMSCSGNSCTLTIDQNSASSVSAHLETIASLSAVTNHSITVDGTALVADRDYTLANGSVIVTFQKTYLDSLGAGKHDIKASFTTSSGTQQNFDLYLTVNAVNPSPSKPSQPKDETCEKVIGPTWHWNNTKGICEDYGVVGTVTR